MESTVGVRELRQNLSKYLDRVKDGEVLIVTERGRRVARLVPDGRADDVVMRLVRERGATMPRGDLLDLIPHRGPAGGPPSSEVLDELREERL
jgi:prevent-host-death family protein